MMVLASKRKRRYGSAVIETAVIASVFLMFLFGIFEYCRFVFMKQLCDNAAREGTRYASVNSYSSTLTADTQAIVTKYMGGMQGKVRNFTFSMYAADSAGANIGTADNAPFGTYICVQIDCDYDPVSPTLLRMGKTIHITAKSYMGSEAN